MNITNQSTIAIPQLFSFYSEESWKENQHQYNDNLQHFFSGKKNEFFIIANGNTTEFLIGTGSNPAPFQIQEVANKFSATYKKSIQAVPTLLNAQYNSKEIEHLILGLFLGTYQFPFKKESSLWQEGFELQIQSLDDSQIETIIHKTNAIVTGQTQAMDWLNKPANFKKVDHISDFLKNTAEKYNLKYEIINKEKAQELGLNAFLAVNQGSSMDCAFTILQYHSNTIKETAHIGLVGKCVLFDTGGVSIKPSANLHYMKSDMGGAVAVIGALIAAAESNAPVNITAILPITDNAVSNNAYLPSDVVTAYNGKTIEVIDTDAEGRMTLADGLSYMAKNYNPDVMIDLATLTGSSVRMFGNTCGALFSNDESLKNQLIKSGDQTNERLWNLPLWNIWKEEFTSDVADFKNISLKPMGDCIIAAKFLEQFIEDHPKWAHLDIAGVAFGSTNYAKEKAATGYGVQLLMDFIENYR